MAKYRALTNDVTGIKIGDIVNFNDPLIDSFKTKFAPVGDDEELTVLSATGPKTGVINPDIEGLVKHLEENGVEFRGDMTVVELFETLKDIEDKKRAASRVNDDDDDDDGGAGGGSKNPDRNELKAKATELEITFASNIPTDRLVELIAEAEAKKSGNQE